MTSAQTTLLSDELTHFANYCTSVVRDAVGPARLTWQERADWAAGLADHARKLEAAVNVTSGILNGDHKTVGSAHGVDACSLCWLESMIEEARPHA